MKRFGLILAACFVSIGLYTAHADDSGDVARAAVRRATPETTTNSNRQKSTSGAARQTPNASHTASTTVRNRTTQRNSGVTERPRTITQRPVANVVSRNASNTVSPRSTVATNVATRNTSTRANTSASSRSLRTVTRAATSGDITRDDILSRDYSKCKTVFYECMDEFCANKDAQLKRCACSSRIHEFDSVKKQLNAVEDKMLDFNQRLLTVSMEKEDVAALNVATEGETAYLSSKDKTDSKKQLDEIAKKLNTSFDSSNFNSNLNVLSWSLNADSAFDNVDSMLGASTTTKSGTALYSAALPVCREMAAEVCTDSDLAIAESGYQATIEQDCNTVAKTYKTQTDQARAQIMESSALLDMSRLNIYQKRNSDDILTCKKKMLDMLTDSTVCGDELGKCLDVTGQYIDPSTGEAFLTTDLVNLGNLLTRPTDDHTWTNTPGNSTFVTFLNSKKKFLEPAMEKCQTIADDVWDSFVEDALSQIKLAQDKKLEDVRKSCTTLSAQCLSDAAESITNFDARALSTFGISADITAQAMCADVLNACTALLESTGADEWITGMSDIATANTYKTMMQTCRQVGRACIIQVCTSTSGNFGLCESIANSTNRKSIINHTACWDQVQNCIKSAGEQAINSIIDQLAVNKTRNLNFYTEMYGTDSLTHVSGEASEEASDCVTDGTNNCVLDMCTNECSESSSLFDCRSCRLAERIWGNCEASPTTRLSMEKSHNRIRKDIDESTLLYWFATSTGTQDAADSCRDTTCGIGYTAQEKDGLIYCYDTRNMCYKSSYQPEMAACSGGNGSITFMPDGTHCQCCPALTDGFCCENGKTISNGLCAKDTNDQNIATNSDDGESSLLCIGGIMTISNNQPYCSGTLVLYDGAHYYSPTNPPFVKERYIQADTGQVCTYDKTTTGQWKSGETICNEPDQWSVYYGD